jgi:WD40 repeat protein/DNA-binding SARP family transcriptional activator
MACLRLWLLGTFQVTLDGVLLTGFESNKVRGLLVYLALEAGRPHSREALATLLWPDWPHRAAMTHLRNALADLRRMIGDRDAETPHLLVTHAAIQFNTASLYQVDAAEFQKLAGEPGNVVSSPEGIKRFAETAAIYQGEFLEGFSVSDSASFEDWVSVRREQLHRLMMQTLSQLADLYLACGEYEQAGRTAQRQIELEPWLEEAHRQLMCALALSDQRSAALVQYETCCRLLKDELGIQPTVDTQQVYEAIRDGRLEALQLPGGLLPAPGDPPFKGLLYFDVGDAGLFFGREALIARLVGHVREMAKSRAVASLSTRTEKPRDPEYPPLLTLVGASGSGKSSVVRAGLAPLLKEDGWAVQVIIPTDRPLDALKGFEECGHGENSTLLVVDQFEEVFTQCHEENEREAFIDQLLDLPDPIIIVLRADFYVHCARYPRLRQAVCGRQEYIGSMSTEELRRAIEEPAWRNGWKLEPGLVELILRDLGVHANRSPEPGALPLLSHALLETWKRRSGRILTLKGYSEAGGVHGAIAKTADVVFAGLDAGQQAITRRIFLRLTELGEGMLDTRRRVPLAELMASPDQADPTGELLEMLAERRLITLSEDNAEVAHEALIREWPALREWLSEGREGLRLHRRLTEAARNWDEMNRDPCELYRGARLAQALEWTEQSEHMEELNLLEKTFMQASQAEVQREVSEREAGLQRELEAAHKLIEAEQKRAATAQTAFARELAVQAELKLNSDPELSLLLALEAASTAKSTGQPVPCDVQQALHDVIATSRLVKTIPFSIQPWNLAYSPDGTRFACEDDTYTIHVLDAVTGGELFKLPKVTGGLAFSPDGKSLATGALNQTVILWDAFTGEKRLTLQGSTQEVWGVVFSPDGNMLATGNSFDDTASIWELTPWRAAGSPAGVTLEKPAQTLAHWGVGLPEADGFHGIEFSPDGKRVATNYQNTAIISEVDSGKALLTLAGHKNFVMDVAFSPDGKHLATASFDNNARVWDIDTGDELFCLFGHTSGVATVEYSPEGDYLATTGRDGLTIVWDAAEGRRLLELAVPGACFDMTFSPDGKRLVTTHEDRTIRIWDVSRDGRGEIAILPDERGHSAAASSPDGTRFAIAPLDGVVEIYEAASFQVLGKLPVFTPVTENQGHISNLAFSHDNSLLAIALGNTIHVWDILSREKLLELGYPNQILSMTFSQDQKWLAAGGHSGRVIVRDISALFDKGKTVSLDKTYLQWELPVTIDYVTTLSFSPDGGGLAASGWIDGDRGGGLVFIWDLSLSPEQPGEPITFVGDYRHTNFIEYSRDGRTLAIGGDDEHAEVWDMTTTQCKLLLTGHHSQINEIHFSPDCKYLITASSDGSAKVWDAGDGRELLSFKLPTAVLSAFFSADGQQVILIPEQGGYRLNTFLDFNDLVDLAKKRLTRDWKPEERRKYLHEGEG